MVTRHEGSESSASGEEDLLDDDDVASIVLSNLQRSMLHAKAVVAYNERRSARYAYHADDRKVSKKQAVIVG